MIYNKKKDNNLFIIDEKCKVGKKKMYYINTQ